MSLVRRWPAECPVSYKLGDSAWVVGETGEVVPPKDPVALNKTNKRLVDQSPRTPAQIRRRILERLSAETLVVETARALLTLLCGSATP